MNILDLTTESPFQNSLSFGWPIFEGPELSKELNPKKGGDLAFEETNITELFIWNGDKSEKADEYIISNSVKPSEQLIKMKKVDMIKNFLYITLILLELETT